MNCGQNLSLPKDIPWRRLAFSPDMFDTKFKDPNLPPKWRTSLTGFYYVVPEEETKDMYPDRKIMYLRVIASITGCNFTNEGLLDDEFLDDTYKKLEEHNVLDKFQISNLEIATGKLSNYYPCNGAIMQVAVFPHHEEDKVSLWDYPYIQDFEPKKREIYETVNKTGEVLSGSTNALNLKKGNTTTSTTEESDILTGVNVETSAFWGAGSAKVAVTGEWGTKKHTGEESSNVTTTDNSREKRETQSYTTNINQMYQPLLSYHLGTNRALWTISPRPHTVDSEFNLINIRSKRITEEGTIIARKLEGIQDMFLVVNMPKNCKGLCFQASLDTGYEVYDYGIDPVYFLVVMRRNIQSCGIFDDKGNFKLDYRPLSNVWAGIDNPLVVNEMDKIPQNVLIHSEELNNIQKKTELVFKANERSKH
ncbi:hypothetical protein, partial [Romboutsia sp.]|uniref:hypothetical protein n=1 Tax=Romboutsia sp. TaxID=1965302 RepID=UPI002C744408